MNTLHSSLQDYLALRRGLGFKMSDAGRMLPGFVAFLEARHESYITAQCLSGHSRPTLSRLNGLDAWDSCVDSHATVVRSIL